jgi:Tfp pilus assembly protein FimV
MSSMTLSPDTYVARPRVVRPRPASDSARPLRAVLAVAPRGEVRLTRRGRFAVFVTALLFVLGAALFLGATSVATNDAGTDQPTEAVMVGEGDTLWAIASDLAPDGEVREMVATIKELNALDSAMLVAGQTLYVPVND